MDDPRNPECSVSQSAYTLRGLGRLVPFWGPPHIHGMPYHRFKVGLTVVAPYGGPHALIPRGLHVIVRLASAGAVGSATAAEDGLSAAVADWRPVGGRSCQ
jgi:hypothetical protein